MDEYGKKLDYSKYIKYRKKWERDPKLSDWIAPIPGNCRAAYCKLCQKQLQQWNKRDLYKHADTLKHQQYRDLDPLSNKAFKVEYPASKKTNSFHPDTRITTSDGKDVTINIVDINEGHPPVETSDEDQELDSEENLQYPRSEQNSLQVQYKDWLEVDGSEVKCTVCNVKLKSRKLDVFKHSLGKWHSRRLAKRSSGAKCRRVKYDECDSRIVTNHCSQTMTKISHGTKTKIDLRSDSFTWPSKKMRAVMLKAELGDDHFQNDENVNKLQKAVTDLLRKPVGLLFPSGTMANLVAVISHCSSRDSEIVMGDSSQQYLHSSQSFSKLGRTPVRTIENLNDGTFSLMELEEIFFSNNESDPPIKTVVCIENAHTFKGGRVLPVQWLVKLRNLCDRYHAIVHLDGTRFMNASLVYGEEPHFLSHFCDSVTFCLDTGLGIPIGTVLAGCFDIIDRAKEIRDMLGGTLHQIGLSAAAGLYALEKNNVDRLLHDHLAAKKIAQCVYDMESSVITVILEDVQTNIVHLYTDNVSLTPQLMCQRLAEIKNDEPPKLDGRSVSIIATPLTDNIVQLMTHSDLSIMDMELIVTKIIIIIKEYSTAQVP